MKDANTLETSPIALTDPAHAHFTRILAANPQARGIRVGVKMSGCSGKSYVLLPIETPTPQDCHFQVGEISLWIDAAQLPSLRGMEIDYVQEGLNQHVIFNNPNATGTCGCGESFTDN